MPDAAAIGSDVAVSTEPAGTGAAVGAEGRIITVDTPAFDNAAPHRKQASAIAGARLQTSAQTKGFTTQASVGAYPRKPLGYRFAKRAFDIAFSTAVIAAGLIPGALLSIAVAADTKGSPIYSQERIGRGGRPFRMYKFRTMVADSDDVEKYLTSEQLERWHAERKVEDDPRITPLGAKLRRLSIDEFPQFVNVWLGQISTIGPRVITAEEMEWFGQDKAKLLSVPPGITGLWQTGPRNAVSFEDGSRQALELSYVDSASLGLDARIFFGTLPAMVNGTGQ